MNDQEKKDLAYDQCLEIVKQCVKDEFVIAGVKEDIFDAIKMGVYVFLEENYQNIVDEVSEGIKKKVENEMNINFRVVRDD